MDITVFTVAYNGYGEFLPKWLDNLKKQTLLPREIIIVLGKNHKAPLRKLKGVTIIKSNSDNIGKLRNLAVEKIKTKWTLYFSADDELLPNAIEEIKNKEDYDVVGLKYYRLNIGANVKREKESAIFENYEILNWKKNTTPGYVAVKGKYYYEEIEIPNYPFLFQLAIKGLKQTLTDECCAVYVRRKKSHSDTNQDVWGEYRKIITEKARDYFRDLKEVEAVVISRYKDKYTEKTFLKGDELKIPGWRYIELHSRGKVVLKGEKPNNNKRRT